MIGKQAFFPKVLKEPLPPSISLMDVKSNVLPKGLQGSAAAPQPQPKRDTDDEKKLSTDVSPSKALSLPPSISAKLRDELIAELIPQSTENHFFNGTIGNNYGGASVSTLAGAVVALNNVAIGTGWNQRVGDSIRMRRLRFRIHIRSGMLADAVDTATGTAANSTYSYAARAAIVLDKMPVIGAPVAYDTGSVNNNPPNSVTAIWTLPSWGAGTFVGGPVLTGTRNPQTLSRYSVLREKTFNPSSKMESMAPILSGGATASIWGQRMGSEYDEWDIDLHDMVTEWYDQGNVASQLTHKLYLVVIADSPSTNPTGFMYQSDLAFVNED